MDIEEAPVNRPAMFNTIDLPSFNSANYSPFSNAEALSVSDISAVPNLTQQPNSRHGTVKKITSSSYSNMLGQLTKEHKQVTKCVTSWLDSNAFIGPSKRRKRLFAAIQLRLTLHHIRTLTEMFLPLTIGQNKRNKTRIVCSVLVVCLKAAL